MELPLVGRSRELASLRAAIDAAKRGSGALVELVGETGVGKSRLIAEAGKFAQDMVRLRATCEVYTRDTPYHAWRGPLRALLGVSDHEPESVVLNRLRSEIESAQPDLIARSTTLAIGGEARIKRHTAMGASTNRGYLRADTRKSADPGASRR